jgi:citrate/tricarballylate utilization protein
MAQVRMTTYEAFAWPRAFGALYRRNGVVVAAVTAGALAAFLLAMGRGAVFSHEVLVAMFGIVFLGSLVAIGVGVMRFTSAIGSGREPGSRAEATRDALTLKYLDGGHGEGCNDEDDRFTLRRRVFHHFTFYGFMLCFAATCVATVYHYALNWPAPYPLMSAPVVLGTLGGIGLVIGTVGLLALNLRRHPMHVDAAQRPMDVAFILLLLATSTTGLVLLALRDTQSMPTWLAVHLGCVMALFLTLPYGKFAHAAYRCVALLKYQAERRRSR